MKSLLLFSSLLLLGAAAAAQTAPSAQAALNTEASISSNGPVVLDYGKQPFVTGHASEVELKIAKNVRHQLLTMPLSYYGMFDDVEYTVAGRTVTLSGWLTSEHSVTKVYAANAVKHIEGVDQVVNNIKVLPPRPFDNQARAQVFRALARNGQLSQYFWPASPDIHIIVEGQNVTLKGYVNTETDKNLATIAVKEVRDVFSVTNDLQVMR